jgi:hypothetical protein
MKTRSLEAELFHVDERTDRRDGETGRQRDGHDKANSRFLQFCERA